MKICLLTPFHASWTKQEISILNELGHTVFLLYNTAPHEDKNAKRFPIVTGLYENTKTFLKSIPTCLRSDLIYCWFVFPTGVFGTILGKFFKKKVILNAVGCDVVYIPSINYGDPAKWYFRLFISWALRNASKVIGESKESARWARVWGAKHVTVVYEGINTEKFKPSYIRETKEKKEYVLLTVSALVKGIVERKGLITLLKALPRVADKFPDVKLVIIGKKGDAYPRLRQIVKDLRIQDKVVFKGVVSNSKLVDFYNQCDIFVLPSLHEGFPTVCAEAQACEKPVISTNTASMPEVIKNHETGLLVRAEDVEELANAIMKLLSDPKLRKQFGKAGRERVIHSFSKEIRQKNLQEMLATLKLKD